MAPLKKKLKTGESKANKGIAEIIRELREDMGKSQGQFARFLGVTKDAVAHWEAGRRQPNRWLEEKIYKIAYRCGRLDLASKIWPWGPTTEDIVEKVIDSMAGQNGRYPEDIGTNALPKSAPRPNVYNNDRDERHPPGGPSPLTREQRLALQEHAHIGLDVIFTRASDPVVRKFMELIDHYCGVYGRKK